MDVFFRGMKPVPLMRPTGFVLFVNIPVMAFEFMPFEHQLDAANLMNPRLGDGIGIGQRSLHNAIMPRNFGWDMQAGSRPDLQGGDNFDPAGTGIGNSLGNPRPSRNKGCQGRH